MAFVRWRGNDKAQVLASVWENGKSKQVHICSFDANMEVTDGLKKAVARDLPGIEINWQEIQRRLDAGPGNHYKETATQLTAWSSELDLSTEDVQKLRAASDVLMMYSLRR